MKKKVALQSLVVLGLVAILIPTAPSSKVLRGINGAEVGMKWATVMETLRTGVCEDDMMQIPDGFCAVMHDSELFRHAYYRFDSTGTLVELALTIREIRGMESALAEIDSTYHLKLSKDKPVIRDGAALRIAGNRLVIREADFSPGQTRVPRGPTKLSTGR